MMKRELILREEALSYPFANGKYDHKNANINFILGHESYKEWLETLPVFTEQDIVKSVLEKIRAEIAEVYINITYQENKNRKATWGLRKAMQIIDKYRTESEDKDGNNNQYN
jgi:hypothetical protein